MYGVHPRIPSDESTESIQPQPDRLESIRAISDARTKANELLLVRAIRRNKVRDSLVKKTSFQPGDWVLMRNESGKKFESKWFGPYRVIQAHPLGTYALSEPDGHVLRYLVNGSRLLEANVDDPKSLWTSTASRAALRRAGLTIRRPEEMRKVLDSDEPPPTYSDLSTFTREEWDEFKRTGARYESVGEEAIAKRVIAKAKAIAEKEKSTAAKNKRQPPEEWDSEENDYESEPKHSETEEESEVETTPGRDADPRDQALFDAPFAVVIPTRKLTNVKEQ